MRYLLIALMLALLPIRGWMGNAMAVEMAVMSIAAAQSSTVIGMNAAGMAADCPMHQQASAEPQNAVWTLAPDHNRGSVVATGSTDADKSSGMLCGGCDTCDLCLAIAQLSWAGVLSVGAGAYPEPASHRGAFSSADRSPGLKPPIS